MRMVAFSRRSGSWRVIECPSRETNGLPTLQRRTKLFIFRRFGGRGACVWLF